jgi:hypothetical protein
MKNSLEFRDAERQETGKEGSTRGMESPRSRPPYSIVVPE